ncbi:uncharacterized protein [Henckelia pumila]|uniref:uncharacterized protein n=1 Tax=Henckelia pumila TaxID=405737 RepID=UPI003C6E5B46
MHALSTEPLPAVVVVTLSLGGGIVSVKLVRNCELRTEGNLIEIDCIVLGLSDFDYIVGIDVLTKYRATVDCFLKVKGAEGFLIYVINVLKSSPEFIDISVVGEFDDVFPDDISGFPPIHEVEFSIELTSGTQPISKASYRMTPVELKELK